MPLVSAAVCPHPMMLIPDIAGEASGEWDSLRSACAESIRRLGIPVFNIYDKSVSPAEGAADLVVIVGGDEVTRSFDPSGAYGSLRAAGIWWEYGWEGSGPPQPLPLSLTLGYWLMLKSKPKGIITAAIAYEAVSFVATPEECAQLGRELAGRAERVAMLAMGEGSTSLPAESRAREASRARDFDSEVAETLARADADALARLDSREHRFPTTGRAAWQVLAGAAAGHRFQGRLHADPSTDDHDYFVASWTRHRADR